MSFYERFEHLVALVLSEASVKMAERVYAQQSSQSGEAAAGGAASADDDVVDAEFEDVSKDK